MRRRLRPVPFQADRRGVGQGERVQGQVRRGPVGMVLLHAAAGGPCAMTRKRAWTDGEARAFEAVWRVLLDHGAPTMDALQDLDREPALSGWRPWTMEALLELLQRPGWNAWRAAFEQAQALAGISVKP